MKKKIKTLILYLKNRKEINEIFSYATKEGFCHREDYNWEERTNYWLRRKKTNYWLRCE